MQFSELIIIYLACGAPFAVHRATSMHPPNWFSVAAAFAVWPVSAIDLVIGHFKRASVDDERFIDGIRSRIEAIAFPTSEIQSVFEFREVYYRFVGLSKAATSNAMTNEMPLFQLAEHPDPSLASRCLARKNEERLDRHRSAARAEFFAAIEELIEQDAAGDELAGIATELSTHLGDPARSADIQEYTPARSKTDDTEDDMARPTETRIAA
ncbi:MAG: hypothetical protein WBO10_07765 [Pyrinomonadaceae bacterium]